MYRRLVLCSFSYYHCRAYSSEFISNFIHCRENIHRPMYILLCATHSSLFHIHRIRRKKDRNLPSTPDLTVSCHHLHISSSSLYRPPSIPLSTSLPPHPSQLRHDRPIKIRYPTFKFLYQRYLPSYTDPQHLFDFPCITLQPTKQVG